MKKPTVYLLGAGATRGAFGGMNIPPPLDSDFFEIALQVKGHGTPNLARKVLKDVWNLYGKVNGVGLETYYRDIETREKIGQFAKTTFKPKDWQQRKNDLNELIRRVIIQTTCDNIKNHNEPLKSDLHTRLLNITQSGDTIITFNYDLLIEESFSSTNTWTPNGGYGDNVHGHRLDWSRGWFQDRGIPISTKSDILLLKLHGSLNWTLYKNKDIRLKPRPYVTRTNRRRPVRDIVSILPPGWNKQIDRKPFSGLWQLGRTKLETCNSLVVLGYSLPETDLLARALVNEVVRVRVSRNRPLKELHIADPNINTLNKYIELFTPSLGYNGRIFRYNSLKDFVDKNC